MARSSTEKDASTARPTAKPKKTLSPKQKEVLAKNKFPKGNPLAASGGLAKAETEARKKALALSVLEEFERRGNFGKRVVDAVEAGNMKKLQCYDLATRIVGGHFDQSEEAVRKIDIKASEAVKRNVVINFRQATPEDAK